MHIEPSQKSLKIRLRKEIRQKRGAIDPLQRGQWDAQINQHLEEYTRQMKPRIVAAYLAFDGEPDLRPTLAGFASQGVKLALPVVQDSPGRAFITLREWSANRPLANNRYGISEPTGTEDIRIIDIDLVLVPLVAWDCEGGRLGMGAGFYDRLFQPFAQKEKPLRIGVGYELQRLPHIPREPWDIHLHGVLTENGMFAREG